VQGNVMLCCGCSMNRGNVVGNFLELTLAELQERKHRHPLCGPCMRLGVPSYFFGRPEFETIAHRRAAASAGGAGRLE
jgi:hypothetical protein